MRSTDADFNWQILSPQNGVQWRAYYDLRWRILRQPWGQPRGSEQDDLEDVAIHRLAMRGNQVIGCGRIHSLDGETAQIRYMAIENGFHGLGVGKRIVAELEAAVRDRGVHVVTLNSREAACGFYTRLGYRLIKPSHTLYGVIPHFEMEKFLHKSQKNIIMERW